MLAAEQARCPHIATINKQGFRQLIRHRFCSRDVVRGEAGAEVSTVSELARASACTHSNNHTPSTDASKSSAPRGVDSNNPELSMFLHCEACAKVDGGKNEDIMRRVVARVAQSKIGGLCNSNLWLCMHCGIVLDQDHSINHARSSPSCHLFIQCHDSHVFCTTCGFYQYPRELGGDPSSCAYLDPIVYQWLLVYGRMRLWWRSLDDDGAEESVGSARGPLSYMRNRLFGDSQNTSSAFGNSTRSGEPEFVNDSVGLKNFGNTCFFTSTCQALLGTPSFVQEILRAEADIASKSLSSSSFSRKSTASIYPVQRELCKLILTCYGWKFRSAHSPRSFFSAVQKNALFGHYDDNTMEDARSLLLDISEALDPNLKRRLFNLKTEQRISCSACGAVGKWVAEHSDPIITVNVTPLESPRNVPSTAAKKMSASEKLIANPMSIHLLGMEDPPAELFRLVRNQFAAHNLEDYKCEKCSNTDTCTRVRRAKSLPSVLVVQIKRSYNGASFEGSENTSVSIKCHRRVIVPTSIDASCLKIAGAEETSGSARGMVPSKPIAYELCAINVHDGGIGGGHNMCYRRDCTKIELLNLKCGSIRRTLTSPPQWTWFSDRFHGSVTSDEVAESEPSLAFYMRTFPDNIESDDESMEDLSETNDAGQSTTASLCKGGCGFFGREDNGGFCSQCG